MVGAWGSEDLIEDAFDLREYDPAEVLHAGPLTLRFQPVPHFVPANAIEVTSARGGRFTFGADSGPSDELCAFARDTDLLLIEATLPEPEAERAARPPHARGGRGARPARGRAAARDHASHRRAGRRLGARARPSGRSAARSRSPARARSTSSDVRGLPDFRLEVYLGEQEFSARHHLTASDAQTLTVAEVLGEDGLAELARAPPRLHADVGDRRAARGDRRDLRALAPEDVLVFAGAEEAMFWALQELVGPGDHAVVTVPNYQSMESVTLADRRGRRRASRSTRRRTGRSTSTRSRRSCAPRRGSSP